MNLVARELLGKICSFGVELDVDVEDFVVLCERRTKTRQSSTTEVETTSLEKSKEKDERIDPDSP